MHIRAYLVEKFTFDPFLLDIFDQCTLFSIEAILHLEDDSFLEVVKEFLLENIQKFSTHYGRIGIVAGDEENYRHVNKHKTFMSLLTPGQRIVVRKIIDHVKEINLKNPTMFENKTASAPEKTGVHKHLIIE